MALHKDVFQQQVWEWFCNDLESCLLVSQKVQAGDAEFKGGINFPAALTIFSVLELCASYFSGRTDDSNLIDRVVQFLVKYFPKHDARFSDADFAQRFYRVFRHGLAHQWSPKAAAVSMDFGKDELLLWARDGEIPCLNVPTFFELTKAALRDYEADLDADEELREKFKTRYEAMWNNDYEQMELLRKMLRSNA
ncbi:MAG: hypothetical protein ACREGG_04165 [Candidatus Saccharimonadales bacterium]